MVKVHVVGTLLAALTSTSVLAQNAGVPAQTTTTVATAPTTQSQSDNSMPHWVGPLKGKPIDTACYRKTYITSSKKCGAGYNFDKVGTCWTQCPLEYPVECGMECLPQNKDCAKQVVTKVASVANAALTLATSGVLGQLTKAAKGVQQGVLCGQQLYRVTEKILKYVEEVEHGNNANNANNDNNGNNANDAKIDTAKDQLYLLLKKTDFVLYDLPVAVTTCLGLQQVSGLEKTKQIVDGVKIFVESVIDKKLSGGGDLLDLESFLDFAGSVRFQSPVVSTAGALSTVSTNSTDTTAPTLAPGSLAVSSLSASDQQLLKRLVGSGGTCGTKLTSVLNKIVATVQGLKTTNPSTAVDAINLAILNSNVVLKELPDATFGCGDASLSTSASASASLSASTSTSAPDGFKNRDQILKTIHVIIAKIVDSSSQNGNPFSADKYASTIANMGLEAIALFDPTGLAAMAAEFVEPVCGPTVYIGDIDDGPAEQALGLESVEKAFRNSTGTWQKSGDGQLKITFKSVDTEDVRVNVLSGGDKIYEVAVKKGTTVVWTKPLSEFQGKTLYLDRWRAGLFGIAGTGGGSLLAWVPNTSTGSLELNATINPTSFSDHK